MSTFTESYVRRQAARYTTYRTAAQILTEEVKSFSASKTYDVFLSHSVKDAEIVLGVKVVLNDHGKSVYVDWLEDPQMDRSKVTPETAETIRQRMNACGSLVYLHTENSGTSKWMPWELGYFDGSKGAVAILPVTATAAQTFVGQEYLGIYPWIDEGALTLGGVSSLRVHKSSADFKGWTDWVSRPRSYKKVA